MPWTFAHAAAVLPLRRLGFGGIAFAGLVIGAISPDAGYYFGWMPLARFAHTPAGLLAVCLPASLLLLLLVRGLQPHVLAVLPSPHRQALETLPRFAFPRSMAQIGWLALSILLGAATHLAWDAFTHATGPAVLALPILQAPLFTLQGRTFQTYNVLQHLSTVVGTTCLVIAYAHWLRRTRVARWTGEGDFGRYLLLASAGVVAVSVAVGVVAIQGDGGMSGSALLVRLVFLATTTFVGLLCLASVVYSRLRVSR